MNTTSNHITNNIITKGWLNISAITKGFILPTFQYIIYVKKKGGVSAFEPHPKDDKHLYDDLKKLKEQGVDVDHIEVFVNWDKQPFKWGKNITAQLIQKKIEVELLNNLHNNYNISVKFIDKD